MAVECDRDGCGKSCIEREDKEALCSAVLQRIALPGTTTGGIGLDTDPRHHNDNGHRSRDRLCQIEHSRTRR